MKKTATILLLFTFLVHFVNAQVAATDDKGEVKQVQPKVMVIPRVNEGEDIRNVLDQNEPLRVAVTKMKEYFDTRGFRTDDFVAKLKAAITNKIFTSENQTDLKVQMLQFANPDIYVELDVNQVACSGAKIARVNMNAFYTSTAVSLASTVAQSPCNNAEFGQLIQRAIIDYADKFLNTMQTNFDDLVLNGVPIYMEFGFSENSKYSMSSEVGTEKTPLSDVIDLWLEKNSYKGQYNIQGTTEKRMIVSDVRIPIRNQSTGANYSAKKFSSEVFSYLKSLGLTVKKEETGSTLNFTIQ